MPLHDPVPRRDAQKVFWLSFCDTTRPQGQQFLGACVVEVTAADADEHAPELMLLFPGHHAETEWIAAAIRKAHRLGCNPGGELLSCELPVDHRHLSRYPVGVLMDRATLNAIDSEIASD